MQVIPLTLLVLVSCYVNTEVAEVQHAKFSEAHDFTDYTREDLDKAFLLDNIFTKPFKISYSIEEGENAVDPIKVEEKIRGALEIWLAPLREYIGEDADKLITASDIVLINETGNYTYRPAIDRKDDAGERESLTAVHVRRGTSHVKPALDGTGAWEVYLSPSVINDKSGGGLRTTAHEFGHMFGLDDTYVLGFRSRRTYTQDKKNRERYATECPDAALPPSGSSMFNYHTGRLNPPSIMQHCSKAPEYPGILSPDDVCGIVEVYADRHIAKNGTKRKALYKKVQNKLMQEYGFECVWSP